MECRDDDVSCRCEEKGSQHVTQGGEWWGVGVIQVVSGETGGYAPSVPVAGEGRKVEEWEWRVWGQVGGYKLGAPSVLGIDEEKVGRRKGWRER